MDEKRVVAGIGVLLMKDNKVLLGKHKDGEWRMPGGKIEFNEEFEHTAMRELMEETGIQAKKLKIVCVNNDKMGENHFVTVGILCEEWIGEATVKEPDKFSEWGWFTMEDLPFPIYLPSAKVMMNLKQGNFYFHN